MSDLGGIGGELAVGDRRSGGFALLLFVLSFLTMTSDGYDLQAASFAAPALIKAWHVKPAALAPLFSSSLVGVLFGAPLFGWVGDRFGRKRAVVLSCLLYGLFSLACAGARSLPMLIALRFVTGIGIGGLLPNMVALNAELAPPKFRAALMTLIFIGVTAGAAGPGVISTSIALHNGWPSIFLIGGAAPLVLGLIDLVLLPESPAFLARRGRAADPAPVGGLFAGRLAVATPLIWAMFIATLLTVYLLTSWLPTLLTSAGFTTGRAAGMTILFQLGGSVGGVVCSLLLGRFGWPVVAALFVLSLACCLGIASFGVAASGATLTVAVCGFAVLGVQFGLNTLTGLTYPAPLRSRGVGLALGLGRLGSIVGPLLGGAIAAAALPPQRLFLIPVAPLALGAVAAVLLVILRPERIGSLGTPGAAGPP